jgi:hypothetical protein
MGSVAISEVDALMYVVLNKAEKNMPYGDLVGTRECITLQTRCRTEIVICQFNLTVPRHYHAWNFHSVAAL